MPPALNRPAWNASRTAGALGVFLILAAIFAVYLPVLGHGFLIYEDPDYVSGNPIVRRGLTLAGVGWAFTTFHGANWFPVTWLSHMLDWTLFGDRPGLHHLVNVALHAVNAALLFAWLRRATGRMAPSLLTAALFALHPLRVEAVAWVSDRKDLLSGALALLTLLAWHGWIKRPSRAGYLGALALYALGLMAKPTLIGLAPALVALDLWPYRRPFAGIAAILARIREKLPFLGLAAATALVTGAAQRAGGATVGLEVSPLGDRVANALVAYVAYLRDTFWPSGMALHYPFAPGIPASRWVGAALILLSVSAAAWLLRRRAPWLLAGWAWYGVLLVPMIGIVQVGAQARADRYTYLAGIGVAWIVAWALADLPRPGPPARVALGLGVAAAVGLGIAARVQVGWWRDDVTLFSRTLAVTGQNPIAHYNLANGWMTRAAGGGPGGAEARGRAEHHFREAVRLAPRFADARYNFANLLSDTGRLGEAIEHYREAVRLAPHRPPFRNNLGVALAQAGREQEAIVEFSEALRLDPSFDDARRNLDIARAAARRASPD